MTRSSARVRCVGSARSHRSCATAAAGVTVDLSLTGPQNTVGAGTDTLVSIENLVGSAFNDNLFGTDWNNALTGGAGNDRLTGRDGRDTLTGGLGSDIERHSRFNQRRSR